jgi:hypothetical protein
MPLSSTISGRIYDARKKRNYYSYAITLFHSVLALEAFDPSRGIDQTLLPGVKGVTIRAHLDVNLRQGGTGFESIAACTGYKAAAVSGVNSRFHSRLSAYLFRKPTITSRSPTYN